VINDDTVLDAGVRLKSEHIPRIAFSGCPTVRVFQKVKVGVLTLGGPIDPLHAETRARCMEHGVAGPMLTALIDGLGAVAIAAPRVLGDADTVDSVLDMLLKECSIVFVAGCVTEARHRALQRTLSTRKASLSDWTLCAELGARLTVGQVQDKVVVCLPSGLAEAFMSFVLLITPLIRRLQGRIDLLPTSRHVALDRRDSTKAPTREFAWAREADVRSEISVRPHSPANPIDAIAWSDGIAGSIATSVLGNRVEARYYPFSSWLR
jgi:molybdopterin molybdotransferase